MLDLTFALVDHVVGAFRILGDVERVAFIFIFAATLLAELAVGAASSMSTRKEDCLIAATVVLACTFVELCVFLRVTLSLTLFVCATASFLLSLAVKVSLFEEKED